MILLVSTSYSPTEELRAESRRLAERLSCRWVPRRHQTINQLRRRYGDQPILLLTDEGLRLYAGGERPIFFHPSMAALRVQQLARGKADPLIDASAAAPGDSVLDCTAGLASDAIVLSFVVGQSGEVTALESEEAICLLIREGLSAYRSDIPGLNEAMRRIRVEKAHHLDYLRKLPGRSVDIVYFDPMFRQPALASDSISPLRHVANPEPLQEEAIREACRVARKTVVMKERRDSGEFARLGFRHVLRSCSKIAYGVIRL